MITLIPTFLKIGITAFGGPLAHIGIVERELVTSKKLISKEDFLNYIGMVNLIPGPNSTQIIMLCGLKLYGILGMIIYSCAFILPATLITLLLAILSSGSISSLNYLLPFFTYLSFGVFPIILFSLITFIKSTSTTPTLTIILILSALVNFFINNEIIVIFVMGIVGYFIHKIMEKKENKLYSINILLYTIFYKFLIIGFTLFGGGFLLIAYVKNQFSNLISNEQILEAIALGQFTPGPILTSSTFIGYQLAGGWGALVATIGIFLPSFILVPLLHKLFSNKNNKSMQLFLNNIKTSSIGVMASITFKIMLSLSEDIYGILLILINSILLYKKIPTPYLIVLSMIYGYIIFLLK